MPNTSLHRHCTRAFRGIVILLALMLAQHVARAEGVWMKQSSRTFAWLHGVYFVDAQRGWAVGGNGALLSTTNGGATWRINPRPTEDAIQDVYFIDAADGWLVCERSIYLLKTEDEPRTYLLHTTNGGATWQRVGVIGKNSDARLTRLIFTADNAHGWAFGEQGALFATQDGGASWSRQPTPTRYLLLGGWFADALNGWLVGAGGSFLQTTDGGATWNALDAPQMTKVRLNAITFADASRGWIVGASGQIFNTTNGGKSWRAQASNTEADLLDVKFADARNGWIVGTEGTVLHTTDGGAHWNLEQSNTTHPLERLCLAGRNRAWAVGFGGTIISWVSGK